MDLALLSQLTKSTVKSITNKWVEIWKLSEEIIFRLEKGFFFLWQGLRPYYFAFLGTFERGYPPRIVAFSTH